MGFSNIFIMMMGVAMVFVFPCVVSKDFVVGDDNGWKLNFDYQAWAQDKDFRVGDKLVFKYPAGAHNVVKVNGTGFQQCSAPALTEALISGSDVITLATPGRKWYICTVGRHCQAGNMKLFITVLPDSSSPVYSPSPAPSPTSPATRNMASMLMIFSIVAAMLV